MAVETREPLSAVLGRSPASGRIERRVHAIEDRQFVDLVRERTRRSLVLIEGGLYVEAHRTLAGMAYAADRRSRQLDPEPGIA